MRLVVAAAVCVVLLTAVASLGSSADCSAPVALSDSWPVSTPEQQALDPKLICATGPSLAKLTGANPHGVIVVRNGLLVYEQYFSGEDMRGYTPLGVVPHNANTLHNIGSITKGIVALLVGIAFDRSAQGPGCPDILVPSRIRRSPHPRKKTGSPCGICCQ